MAKRFYATVLMATLLMATLVTAAVPASAGGAADRVAAMQRAVRLAASGTKQAAPAQPGSCFTDPTGDTRDFNTGAVAASPQADIVEHCVAFDSQLTLSQTVASPTDPLDDAAWSRGTFAGWFVDVTGDNQGEFFVTYYRNASNVLAADVRDIRNPNSTPLVCTASAVYDGSYAVERIPTSCLNDPTAVRVQPGMFYDASTGSATTPIYSDVAPNDGTFASSVEQAPDTPLCESPEPAPFADRSRIAAVHRANVDCLYELGIATGRVVNGERYYKPGQRITRAQFSGFTRRSLDHAEVTLPAPQRPRFDDVGADHTFDDDIHRLAAAAILVGYSNGNRFGPGDRVRRDQTATILLNAYEYATSTQLSTTRTYFSDIRTSVHVNNINAAFEGNLMNGVVAPQGDELGRFEPRANTTRQQMASVLVNFLEQL